MSGGAASGDLQGSQHCPLQLRCIFFWAVDHELAIPDALCHLRQQYKRMYDVSCWHRQPGCKPMHALGHYYLLIANSSHRKRETAPMS